MNVPLIVGLGEGENFLASDVAAVLAHTRRVIFLEEGDVADITADVRGRDRRRRLAARAPGPRHRLVDRGGREGRLRAFHAQGDARAARGDPRGDHRPRARRRDRARRAGADRRRGCKEIERVEFVACGTANYAAAVGAYVIQDWLHMPARWNVGSEFRYSPPPLDEQTLVVAVTQSGETADTIAPTRYARQQGCPIIAVTNTVGSAITREADAVLFLQAGPEIAVVATKTFATQVTTLILLAAAMAKQRGRLPRERERQLVARAARAARQGRSGRSTWPSRAKELARRYVNSRGFMFVGRGVDLPGRARGRAEAQGSQLRPRRGLRRGRAQARPDLAARRRGAAGRHRDALVGPGEAHQQRHGGPRARRARARRRDRGRRRDARLRRRHPVGARDDRGALARSWRRSRSSCSPTTRPWRAARTSTSRATSRSR